ncbi:MAG TPA: DUF1343 domain-containing protein [Candidatus Avimuribaculum pullicola]|nr:DUF1343 domain-containing protein [Candidatus Avimuribaculum pullicola]
MKKYIITVITAIMTIAMVMAQTKPGIETLRDSSFKQLQGKRVGLITNPTGVDRNLRSTIDILHEAPGVELVALYGPEHGVRGDVHAGDKVESSIDPATGVKVYSLYGATQKPTSEMLEGVDVLVYDIQDIGCRSFTYISTMGKAMEACIENDIEFMVLDRPNPLGGNKVEGCIVEDGFTSFVSQYPIPYVYGLTPGELAILLNEEGLIVPGKKARLTVVPMSGWSRDMKYGDTGMPWVLPSPHIPQIESSYFYPATGIIGEFSVLSIGVGYTLPFQLACAEWIDAEAFCRELTSLGLPGMEFRPIHIKPFYAAGQGKNLHGVQVYITDLESANLSLFNFYVMQALAKLYPDHKVFDLADPNRFSMFDRVCGTDKIRTTLSQNYQVADIIDYWNKDVESFKALSAKYYLY